MSSIEFFRAPRVSRRRFLAGSVEVGALFVAACAPARSPGPPPRLTLLEARLPFAPLQAPLADAEAAAAKEAGVAVSTTIGPAESLRSKLASATAAGQLPDLLLASGVDSTALAGNGLLVDLRETLDQVAGLNGDLFEPVREVAAAGPFVDRDPSAKPPAYAIPFLSVGWGWLLRRDRFASKGFSAPKDFDQARYAASHLVDSAAGRFGFAAPLPLDDASDNLVHLALLAYSAPLFDSAGFQVTLDPSPAVAAFMTLDGLFHGDGSVPPGAVDWSAEALEAAFAAGRIAQIVDSGGSYGRLVTANPRLRDLVDVFPPPGGPQGRFTAATVFLYAVPNRVTSDQARALVERVLQPGRYAGLIQAGEGSAIPPYAYLTKGPYWDRDPNYAALFANTRGDPSQQFQYAGPGYPGPLTPAVALVWQRHLLAASLRSVVRGELTPQAAVAALRDRAAEVARGEPALQPTPSPTPEPFWLQWIQRSVPGGK